MSGRQERKWYEQLRFRLTGRWSLRVVDERLRLADERRASVLQRLYAQGARANGISTKVRTAPEIEDEHRAWRARA